MKQIVFLTLTLMVLSVASVNAQVRIGGTDNPHTSAVLDLNANDVEDGDLGLALPRVALGGLSGDDAQLNGAAPAPGTVVYNTNPTTGGTTGLYVWNGSQWIYLNSPATASPITTVQVGIDVGNASSDSYSLDATTSFGIDTIYRGIEVPLQLTLTPDNAVATDFGWSAAGAGVKITPDGKVTGNYNGGITVRATSPNGVFGEKRLVVKNSGLPVKYPIGSNEYYTFDYNGKIWMIENLKEVVENVDYRTTYNSIADGEISDGTSIEPAAGERGYYYLTTNPMIDPCPAEWHLPSVSEAESLVSYLLSGTATVEETQPWEATDNRGGLLNAGNLTWQSWGVIASWPTYTFGRRIINQSSTANMNSYGGAVYTTVRCVKTNS
jgi:uncharacterized protein (TIGR02145 family)